VEVWRAAIFGKVEAWIDIEVVIVYLPIAVHASCGAELVDLSLVLTPVMLVSDRGTIPVSV
jgi:hypothetical protein